MRTLPLFSSVAQTPSGQFGSETGAAATGAGAAATGAEATGVGAEVVRHRYRGRGGRPPSVAGAGARCDRTAAQAACRPAGAGAVGAGAGIGDVVVVVVETLVLESKIEPEMPEICRQESELQFRAPRRGMLPDVEGDPVAGMGRGARHQQRRENVELLHGSLQSLVNVSVVVKSEETVRRASSRLRDVSSHEISNPDLARLHQRIFDHRGTGVTQITLRAGPAI